MTTICAFERERVPTPVRLVQKRRDSSDRRDPEVFTTACATEHLLKKALEREGW